MRNYEKEKIERINFIQRCLQDSNAKGIVYGNSGGKDCALVGILCKLACENTTGIIMPCQSSINYNQDRKDAMAISEQFHIKTVTVDVSAAKEALMGELGKIGQITKSAQSNINPRLRMTTLYAYAQSNCLLVAGTGNRSERYMGYFTKHGDGGCDFNPISDLCVEEVYEFLRYFNVPENIITKAPSAGLFEGQTDEEEMGVTYDAIDNYILRGQASEKDKSKIKDYHTRTSHKRRMPIEYNHIEE